MKRDEMITTLIDNDLSSDGWGSLSDKDAWLEMILRSGFAGYENMTDAELRDEINGRGLN